MASTRPASRWRTSLFAAVALAGGAHAVSLNACSTQNYGAANPVLYETWMTATDCQKNCQNYLFGIVQGVNCWCSNYFASTTTSLGSCSKGCPGWPDESCADTGYFGYIAINALGTAAVSNAVGAVGGSSSPTSAPQQQSSVPAPQPTSALVVTSVNVVVSTSYAVLTRTQVSTQVVQPPSSSSAAAASIPPQTILVTQVVTTAVPSPVTIPAPASSSSPQPSSTPQSIYIPSPVTSIQIITVSGAVVTQTVTSTPTAPPSRAPSSGEVNTLPRPESHGISNGAVAGITVGAIAGAVILGALVWFLCFRRRRDNDEENGSMRRQPSVLSKVGLLRGDSTHIAPARRQQLPSLQTTGLGNFSGPASANTGHSRDMTDRGARPAFVDSRLNPHAIMTHANASRSSVGTLQDNQDYSRPLEVRNPDF